MLYFGIVEDRKDPKEMGRVRVRVFGLHSSDKINDIPTGSLPWAPVMNPTTTPGVSGLGQTPFLVPGSWVVVQFLDKQFQSPIVMGSVNGFPSSKPNPENGFSDPVGTFPREIDESDIERRARGVNDIGKQSVGSEPADPYNAKYPYNRVIHSESGHMIEMDDTPGSERVHVYHRTGAFIEIHPDGSMVVHSGKHFNSSQKLEINVTDNANINVGGNLTALVEGTTTLSSFGNITAETKANMYTTVEGNLYTKTFGNSFHDSQGNINVKTDGLLDIHSSGNIKMSSKGDIDIAATGTFKISSIGAMDLVGSTIDLNKSGASATPASFLDYSDDETAAFKPDISENNDNDVQLVSPLYSVVEPDGNTSYSQQTSQGVTIPRKDQSSQAQTSTPVAPSNVNPATDGTVVDGASGGTVTYRNSAATRRLKLVPALENILQSAANSAGLDVVIFSGGQDETTGTVGSHRHDDGYAADIWLYKNGSRLSMVNNVAEASDFAAAAKSAGELSIGAGSGYMGGVGMHVDISPGNTVALASAKYWGSGGRSANAPSWLRGIMA